MGGGWIGGIRNGDGELSEETVAIIWVRGRVSGTQIVAVV